ncbi:BQ2448_7185 [Microbotryum intermedium]|uniref:BQ2448_7185 protein n=1 Tax=Microbotryum intermedium TaxID=269621 RepID=A0A238FHG6_9BASI|nr:BQ2448_7185 [Microbotryum intermedium]
MVDEAVVQPPSCTAQLGHDDCNPPERSHTSVISAENSKSDPDRSPNQRHQPRPGPPPFPRPHPLRSTTASRQGSPASNRNFNESSSGGINLVTLNSKGGGGKKKKGSSWRDEESGEGHLEEEADEGALERRKKEAWGTSYLHEHDSIRNDYSKHYVETGQRPQNFIRGAQVEERFSEYPKLSRLLDLKHALLSSPSYSIPPTYLNLTPSSPHMTLHQQLDPTSFKFDVILVTPPPLTTFEELKALDLGRWSHWPGFVWLWVGDGRNHTENRGGVKRSERGSGGVGLEKGRELLGLWGYRRCEDIVWLKTNRSKADESESPSSLFTPSIEHCLMGIRGTVRRSTDPWFVHCNVDTDVMIWEGDPKDPFLKPPELQSLIENFCQGTRRLHLYGSTRALRRGWLTVKIPTTTIEDHDSSEMFSERSFVRPIERELDPPKEWKPTVFDRSIYTSWFHDTSISGARHIDSFTNLSLNEPQNLFLSTTIPSPLPPYLPYHPELDTLRPKSPPARAGQASSGGLGRGRGAGLGVTRSVVAKGVGLRMLHQQRGQGQGQGQGGSGMGSGMGMGMRGAVFRPPTSSMYQDHKIHPDSILDPIEERTWTTPPPRFTHTPGQEQGHTQGASFELPLHQQQQQHYHLQQRQYHQEWFIPIGF